MLHYISYIVCTLLFILILIYNNIKHKAVPEKYYFLNMFLYFLVSAVYVGYIPFGFLFCALNMISYPDVKNKKVKIMAITLGFLSAATSILVSKYH